MKICLFLLEGTNMLNTVKEPLSHLIGPHPLLGSVEKVAKFYNKEG